MCADLYHYVDRLFKMYIAFTNMIIRQPIYRYILPLLTGGDVSN